MAPKKVAIIGCGSWGTAISRIVGENVRRLPTQFEETVRMWVFEELVDGKKLSEIINTEHVNVKYLPGRALPTNIVGVPDLIETVKDASILIFAMPHQFVDKTCRKIADHISDGCIGVSLIKGLTETPDGSLRLITEEMRSLLDNKIEMTVLMGANLANEVAEDQFCEATIGSKDLETGKMLKRLFHSPNFRISVVKDSQTAEVCGALKNIIACGAGFGDGLDYADTTKSAVIRLGLIEMIRFIKRFFKHTQLATFLESCGVADLVTTCYGGRNRKCAEMVARTGKTMEEVEGILLNGQKLQGPATAAQAYRMIVSHKLEDEFPLFVSVHKICRREIEPINMMEYLRQSSASIHVD